MTDEIVAARVSVGDVVAAVAAHVPAGSLTERVRGVLRGLTCPNPHPTSVRVTVTHSASAWTVAGPRVGTHQTAAEHDMPSLVEWVVVEELRASLVSLTQLHAAAAWVDGRAVVVIGPSGAGKSSLALAWSRMGLPLYGDDVVLLDATGHLHAFPRLGKVETAVARAQGLDPAHTVDWMEGATEVWVDPAQHGGWAPPALPALVVRAQWQAEHDVSLAPMSPTAMLADLPHHVLSGPATSWDTLTTLVAAETCMLTFGDAPSAAALLAERVR